MTGSKIYIIGYGNRFRQDDGLGPELAEKLSSDGIVGVTVIERYQLSIEDAYDIAISGADFVIFIDASFSGDKPFSINTVEPVLKTSISIPFTTPGTILYLCETMFNRKVRGYLIGIRGYEWGFSSVFSANAAENFEITRDFINNIIKIVMFNDFSCCEPDINGFCYN